MQFTLNVPFQLSLIMIDKSENVLTICQDEKDQKLSVVGLTFYAYYKAVCKPLVNNLQWQKYFTEEGPP